MAIRSLKSGSFSRSTKVGNSIILPGDYESIATTTLSTSASSITFSSIPSTYTHLQIRALIRLTTGIDSLCGQFNSDTATNYSYHRLAGNGSSANSSNGINISSFYLATDSGFPAAANTFGVLILDILDYANTNKYKTTRSLGGFDANGSGGIELDSGLWRSTSAINTIKLFSYSGYSFTQYSSFALYGIRG